MTARIATGLSCQPLPDGTVQVEFHDDGGATTSSQIVSADLLMHLPMVVRLTLAVVDQGAVAGSDQHGGQLGRT